MCMFEWVTSSAGAYRSQERALDSLELEKQGIVGCFTLVLGIEHGSSTGAARIVLNY